MLRHKLIVQKYGGSSVADIDRIKKVAGRIAKQKKRGYGVVAVVSALGDTTDKLISLAQQITDSPSEREMDMLMSTGEQISIALLAMALHRLGLEAISFTGAQVGIITDASHTKAKILDINSKRIESELKKDKIVIVAGFQGITISDDITTLGRGGSNLTAVALAKALSASTCEMCTDVKGVYTADPRIVPSACKIARISYEEMLELASAGVQVLQPRSIEVAKKFNVPIHIRPSFSDTNGTIISKEVKAMEDIVVRGVAVNKNEAKITICAVPDKPGIAAKIFKRIAESNINIDMIIQNVSRTGYTDISFTVMDRDLNKTIKITEQVARSVGAGNVECNDNIAKLSIVGIGMRSHSGIASRMFSALARNKVNIDMISTSEIKISCVINKKSVTKAARAVHREFKLSHSSSNVK